MNILVTAPDLHTERQMLRDLLQEHGFDLSYIDPVCRGEVQRRYTIRRHLHGDFVAWFCWHAEPAVSRPHTSRPRREHHNVQLVTQKLSSSENRLLKEVLARLAQLHPVTTE